MVLIATRQLLARKKEVSRCQATKARFAATEGLGNERMTDTKQEQGFSRW